ncbi:DUF2530 domain-containing protein [Naasia lichenicola]|uniref:DUF2530 domain-containing protein n=1 Tax=Naasia lichenicola TaxID=2565933 RepID=A0A4S4FJ28_9MICO|nr:DUF2530 domain-containing protein [Naasia lichenicola]THG29852.1 DUF2530 domain-containing protein [Naasia lichenicola]
MRLYLKDSERRPDPRPVQVDERRAVFVGLVVWIIATVIYLLVFATNGEADAGVVWTCTAGIALGLAGLVYTERRRRKLGH